MIRGPAVRPRPPRSASKGWVATARRTVKEFKADNLTDWAAALTYYAILSLVPALIALVSIVGLVGDPQSVTDTLTKIVSSVGPASAVDTFKTPIEQVTANRSGAGLALVLSPRGRPVERLGLHRRLHARLQRDLRGRRGAPVLEAAPRPAAS